LEIRLAAPIHMRHSRQYCINKAPRKIMDDSKVISLAPVGERSIEPNALAVERAEQLLKDAKSGAIQGFIVVGETKDGALYEGGASVFDLPLVYLGLQMAQSRLLTIVADPE
jgi:hypothetical protein